jgi:hypothetical protein
MIIFEYLFWILFIGYCYLVAIRLKWLFEKVEGHPFWKKPNAMNYYFAAGILFLAVAAVLLLKFNVLYLLLLLLGEYVLIASPAVKVNERGIMTNAFLARWPDVLHARQLKSTGEIIVLTKQPWQRIRLQVPADQEAAFRKMLAAKGIRIINEDVEKPEAHSQTSPPSADENKSSQQPESLAIENPA